MFDLVESQLNSDGLNKHLALDFTKLLSFLSLSLFSLCDLRTNAIISGRNIHFLAVKQYFYIFNFFN